MNARIDDVARRAGVSVATVSRALRGLDVRAAGRPVDGPILSVGLDLPNVPSLTTDPVAAASAAARHLRRLGHRRIGLIGDPGASAPTIALEHLRAGTSQALREIGVTPRGTAVVRRDASFAGGIDAMATMLREPLPPTAVLAGSDEMAAGARWAAVEAGLEVPGDLSIVGFGGRDVALHAGLTTVAQPVTEMGETAATLVLAAMAGAEVTDTVLPCTLVVRHSSGRDHPPRGGGRSGRTGQAAASRLESGSVDGRP